MVESLVKLIISQFVSFIEKKAKRYHIKWARCFLKLIERHYYEDNIIDVYYKHRINNTNDFYLPLPLVTIIYTNIIVEDLNKPQWIDYLDKKASDLLNKIESEKNYILPTVWKKVSAYNYSDRSNNDQEDGYTDIEKAEKEAILEMEIKASNDNMTDFSFENTNSKKSILIIKEGNDDF